MTGQLTGQLIPSQLQYTSPLTGGQGRPGATIIRPKSLISLVFPICHNPYYAMVQCNMMDCITLTASLRVLQARKSIPSRNPPGGGPGAGARWHCYNQLQ